ncbi:MAG: cytochrome ubiquinol oxidase subunit I [Bacteroidales bacterium]|jgi:cytochrome d ubiquinol oxidase subunit I|nr:cytochrome ubiquinol oxidase subunit I [Bacteroidales bacterium]MDX9927256.1 cytochrome ubiquinol oxidase subunit I [Bacteroidales bacterium]HNX83898.1 cytochrome ubiquinol oxidase subunit I [Bacteroidales bacterium]HPS97886.1 cytochrome ubiquinol oxidase subunit I [Bacteroidales bacterium]
MIENFDLSLVNWSRAQFALTAIYHWLFVPLTLGLSFILAFMETLYVRTGDEMWKKITKFWMTLFGINFAIGVATGIILEFEFGTNWSNYSWFVGDIFGAPLAVEGILAFFLESTFVAVMFFGWNKVSKKFHLASTWLVAIGANLSALWILVANAWMENPVGMVFNPDTARNEMNSFREVVFNPVAIDKFLHTVTSGFVLASVFVVGISAWFLIRKREQELARKSILIAGIFGLVSGLAVALTGDSSARTLAQVQPVKFAAMEALYEGKTDAGLTVIGALTDSGERIGEKKVHDMKLKIEIPKLLSIMTTGKGEGYVPGLRDLIDGNPERGILSVSEMMERGRYARQVLIDYKMAKELGDTESMASLAAKFEEKDFTENYFRYFGYSYFDHPWQVIPSVPVTFYAFRVMVGLGFFFILLFVLAIWFHRRKTLERNPWFLWIALFSIPLAYLASELGWIVTEMGRQPWIIQNLMPVHVAVSNISAGAVQTTFWLFAVLFTALLIAEISIMVRQIKTGPKH